jgi:hypothetical protein
MPSQSQPLYSYERIKVWLSFALAVLSAVGTIVFYHFRQSANLQDAKISIQIVDAANKSPIASSRVELEFPNGKRSVTTDGNGMAFFTVPARLIGTNATLRAQAFGFTAEDRLTVVGKDEFVYLTPFQDSSHASGLVPYTQVFRTGLRPSGRGREFSAWYELAADPPRPGYVIDAQDSTFTLVGDRTCNTGWSQCVPFQATETSLVWRFRMQGHNERPFDQGVAPS